MFKSYFVSAAVAAVVAIPAQALVIIDSPTAGQTYSDDVNVVTGGQVNGSLAINGVGHTVNIFDGVITEDLGVVNGVEHIVNVSGGAIGNDIRVNGVRTEVNISGGSFAGGFITNGVDSVVNIFGSSLMMSGDFDAMGATITGFLADGTAIDNLFRAAGFGHTLNLINVEQDVPAPGALGLLGLGLLGMGVAARRRRA